MVVDERVVRLQVTSALGPAAAAALAERFALLLAVAAQALAAELAAMLEDGELRIEID